MPEDNHGAEYTYKNSGTNSQVSTCRQTEGMAHVKKTDPVDLQGNHYCTRYYGQNVANTNAYHYSNQYASPG